MSKLDVVIEAGCELGESPVWDIATQTLWWTDINGRKLHHIDPSSGRHESYAMPGRVGSFALRASGGLVLAMEQGFSFFDLKSGAVTTIATPEAGLAKHRFNDGRCDPQGRFLAGSMNTARDAASAKLWRLNLDHSVEEMADDCTIANGLAWSPDGKTMYWVDGGRQHIYTFDYPAVGKPTNRTVWIGPGMVQGRHDGAAVDSEGCYWTARWNGHAVVRLTPEGKIDRIIDVPVARVSMCAFGGRDLKTLYITTAWENAAPEERTKEPLAGAVFAIDVGIAGRPEPSYAG